MTAPSTEGMAAHIVSAWTKTSVAHRTFGELWYPTANAICGHISQRYNLTVPHIVAVLSALSPRRSWERNVIDTEIIASRFSASGYVAHNLCTRAQTSKIWNILTTRNVEEILPLFKPGRAPKTRAFYLNVLYAGLCRDHPDITIDRHAIRAAWGPKAPTRINYSTYQAIEQAYVWAWDSIIRHEPESQLYSSEVVLPSTPQALQATVWLHQRQQGRTT